MKKRMILIVLLMFFCNLSFAEEIASTEGTRNIGLPELKDPWEAARRSALLPGWGQKYAGDVKKGDEIMMSALMEIAFTLYVKLEKVDNAPNEASKYQGQFLYDTFLYMLAVGYVANIIDAYCITNDIINGEYYVERNPWEAVFKSAGLPGFGQFFGKNYLDGILYVSLIPFFISKSSSENYHYYDGGKDVNLTASLTSYLGGAYYLTNLLSAYFGVSSKNEEARTREGQNKVAIYPEYDFFKNAFQLKMSYAL